MGQVWSKADFDGVTGQGNEGGRGSCLCVTAQNPGADNVWGTGDDALEPLNGSPVSISSDSSPAANDTNSLTDRVRGFSSFHPAGANFVNGDGSVKYFSDAVDSKLYRELSTKSGGEVVSFD